MSRIAAFLTMLAVGLATATSVMAQNHGHGGGGGFSGHGGGGSMGMGRPGGSPGMGRPGGGMPSEGGFSGHGGPGSMGMGRPGGSPGMERPGGGMPSEGRFAGPYGYAYPGGGGSRSPGYPSSAQEPYRAPAYPPPGYAGPARRPNSLGPDWRFQQEEARFGVRHGHFAPLGRVIDSLQRRAPGRQLDAGIEYDGGRPVYRVRWITVHGRRIDFLVDAVTGAVIGER